MKRGGINDHDAAYCAAAWASGEKQRSLALTLGYNTAGIVSLAIAKFLDKYSGLPRRMGFPELTGDERKTLVPAALEQFKAQLPKG